ncbi:hypothetical protein AVEN_32758-1 [Araneus ventricosus]|uniref:Uncharacterized protein n=1 Tax=Araneus ventricosus TaxID=182803 RepID=A0A4Y2CY35_ARAVE|nr:hypothetical protein AVEN_32758-1 [Araneus ventricosus]
MHFQSHNLSQRYNLVDYMYCLKPSKVTFDHIFRSKLLPSRSEGCLGNTFPRIFDYLEADNDVDVMLLKLSESKIGSFMVSRWFIGRFNNMSEHLEKCMITSYTKMLAKCVLDWCSRRTIRD